MSTLKVNVLQTVDGLHSVNVADIPGVVATAGMLNRANNLSDLSSAPTARANLGLGTAATHNTGDFAAGSDLSTEASTRGTADSALSALLSTEASTRAAADALTVAKANNLSDVADKRASRRNLGLYEVWVEDFGAVGNYNPSTGAGTDDWTAIQGAVNYAQTLASPEKVVTVKFRAKNYLLSATLVLTPASNCPIRLEGQGGCALSPNTNDVSGTRLFFNGGSTWGINVAGTDVINSEASHIHFEIRNLGIIGKSVGAQYGLIIGTGSNIQLDGHTKSLVENVYCAGWTAWQLYIVNTRQVEFRRLVVDATANTGAGGAVMLISDATTFTGDLNFYNCDIVANPDDMTSVCVLISHATAGIMGGIHFTDSNLYYGLYGCHVLNAGSGRIDDIFFGKTSFDGRPSHIGSRGLFIEQSGTGNMNNLVCESAYCLNYDMSVEVKLSSAGTIQTVRLVHNYFSLNPSGGIKFDQGGAGGLLQSLAIANNTFSRVGSDVGNHCVIRMVNACKGFAITGNTYVTNWGGSASATVGWVVKVDDTTADGYTIIGNTGQCNTAAVFDAGTTSNKAVANNVKF